MEQSWGSASYQQVIKALSQCRQSRGVSQRELARRLGKHPSFVNKIENLERRLDILEFVAIAGALQARPADLLNEVLRAVPRGSGGYLLE